jgi:hypothetical protein
VQRCPASCSVLVTVVSIWFNMLVNSVSSVRTVRRNVDPRENAENNFVVNFPGTQFQAQQAYWEIQVHCVTCGQETCQITPCAYRAETKRSGGQPLKSLRRPAQEDRHLEIVNPHFIHEVNVAYVNDTESVYVYTNIIFSTSYNNLR